MERRSDFVFRQKFEAAMPEQMERFRGAFWAARGRIGDQFAVMLHLRSLYVSKAAILTISALSVPVENRSPA